MERVARNAHHVVGRRRPGASPRPKGLHAARALQPGFEPERRQECRRDLPARHRSGDEGADTEDRRYVRHPATEQSERAAEITPVIASERSNPVPRRRLDCFVASLLAMTNRGAQTKTPGRGPGFVFRKLRRRQITYCRSGG